MHGSMRITRITSSAVFLIGFISFIAWFVPALQGHFPGFSSMKANTSVAFIFCGLSLLVQSHFNLQKRSELTKDRGQLFVKFCASAVGGIGLVTLGEYASGLKAGIDQLLVSDIQPASGAFDAGRMSPATAVGFLLAGAALFLAGGTAGTARIAGTLG